MTQIKEMHKNTLEWNKLLGFYSMELIFFKNYIQDYSKRMSDMDKRDIINAFNQKIDEQMISCQTLKTDVDLEESELLKSIEDINYSGFEKIETNNSKLVQEMFLFEAEIKALKEGIYDFFIETSI